MSTIADKVCSLAVAQIGYQEGKSGAHWDNHEKYAAAVPGLAWAQDEPWCAVFTSWVYYHAGAIGLAPTTASCDAAGQWYRAHHATFDYPAIGAQVLYGTRADYVHTGIVIGYDGAWMHAIEGNANNSGSREGDGVYSLKHLRRSSYVSAYGYPLFPGGITSADPKALNYKKTAGKM